MLYGCHIMGHPRFPEGSCLGGHGCTGNISWGCRGRSFDVYANLTGAFVGIRDCAVYMEFGIGH